MSKLLANRMPPPNLKVGGREGRFLLTQLRTVFTTLRHPEQTIRAPPARATAEGLPQAQVHKLRRPGVE